MTQRGLSNGHFRIAAEHWQPFVVIEEKEDDTTGCSYETETLALKHESRILGQWSNPVSGSRKSQASSPWVKQHKL